MYEYVPMSENPRDKNGNQSIRSKIFVDVFSDERNQSDFGDLVFLLRSKRMFTYRIDRLNLEADIGSVDAHFPGRNRANAVVVVTGNFQ